MMTSSIKIHRYVPALALLLVAVLHNVAAAQSAPADAAALYLRGAEMIQVDSPANSNLEYRPYPPFPEEWDKAARKSWVKNEAARDLVRQARSIDEASWPADGEPSYLNEMRAIAIDLGDGALFEHVRGNHAAAIELILDLRHLTNLLRQKPAEDGLLRLLVAVGIDALAMDRLMVITSGVTLTTDAGNKQDVQIGTVRQLIADLLEHPSAEDQLSAFAGKKRLDSPEFDRSRMIKTINRVNAERTFAAMSLACHIYRFENGRWPEKLEELVPDFLARVPIDPWGDGTQTFGYALIKGGLPDGSDRPLVYCRNQSRDGLAYRLDAPQYSFYVRDGSDKPSSEQEQTGQFRDVARWIPMPRAADAPTLQALP